MMARKVILSGVLMLAFSIAMSACIKSPESALYSVIVDPFPRDQMTLHPIGTLRKEIRLSYQGRAEPKCAFSFIGFHCAASE